MKPSKTTPLRSWGAASYDPKTGHAASSLMRDGTDFSADGVSIKPSGQVDAGNSRGRGGAPGWSEFDRIHSQGGTPGDE
jgi:hypothetical protein